MRDFQLIALTPPGLSDPSIALAAARAGYCGVLDLEYIRNERIAVEAMRKLAWSKEGTCGIKVSGRLAKVAGRLIPKLPAQVRIVILTPGELDPSRSVVRLLVDMGVQVLWECTSMEEALQGKEAGAQGLIAKGHEAAGRVGEETTFVLLQRMLTNCSLPVFAQGGIGLHTISAACVAGAAGAVLDAQLWLTRECTLPGEAKDVLSRMDGSETSCLSFGKGNSYRVYSRPGLAAVEELRHSAKALRESTQATAEKQQVWWEVLSKRVGWRVDGEDVWMLGQDAAFASTLAARFRTVPGVLHGLQETMIHHIGLARRLKPLAEHSPLARSHNTRYPIVQGPMTRVSDTAEFALRVAEAGALPFLALALMKASEVSSLLRETQRALGNRPWGVGILGFVPLDLREEQLGVIRQQRPPFALIAGGRPDQARSLEDQGIPTYLHVPSPGLLRMFVENGARRFVFEGRECGGHVGPRSSFVLWESMVEVLLDTLPADEMSACHVLFAGGVHDALSASMVATISAPLAEHGVKIGTLLGTAYLFTREAVEAGAIVPAFQRQVLECDHTVLLETGPGHAIRCVPTSYFDFFEREKQRLREEGKSPEEVRVALEDCNVGRLRIASKGVTRRPGVSGRQLMKLSPSKQRLEGMYMVGQLASIRRSTCLIADIHHDVSAKGTERLLQTPALESVRVDVAHGSSPCDVAIVGMGCLLPKARDVRAYWENILAKVDAITEIPRERWNWQTYYDDDLNARDKIYSRWGGFLDDVPFDPLSFGIPPNTLSSIEPLQLLTLEVVRAALADAGYAERQFSRERASVILGAGGGVADLGNQYAVRSALPMFDLQGVVDLSRLPEWTEDSFPGILVNVAAGRVANRFNLGGVNYTVDAACASSLAAMYLAVRELEAGTSDLVIAGGADTVQNPFAYLCFSKTHALSRTGRCHTFDESADGIAISEGLAMLVLKRRRDAERDGDKIYALIRGIAGSSDGRDRGLTAPRPEGQKRALTRAYAQAGVSPATVGLVEAHGTGTVAGDLAEVEALKSVFEAEGARQQSCALGSVKSMIGHTKCTAGVAGLIKVALALHHKVLPPTLGVQRPNSKARIHESPFYINSEVRPWIHSTVEHPRRAGVSAFGFGGTNFHAVLEEYGGAEGQHAAPRECWENELFVWRSGSRAQLIADSQELEDALANGAKPKLGDLAFSLWGRAKDHSGPGARLAVVADSLADLKAKLQSTRLSLLASGSVGLNDPRGVYFGELPTAQPTEVAFLFPGQGSQYPGMLTDVALHFAEVREQFEMADQVLASAIPTGLSRYVFPSPPFTPEEQAQRDDALRQTNIAQPALGAADLAMCHLLRAFGVAPLFVAGHSYGEYVALCAAGVFSEDVLLRLSEARGRIILQAAEPGTMAAVSADRCTVEKIVEGVPNVWIANINSPRQTILSGTSDAMQSIVERIKSNGHGVRSMAVSCAFHSPVMDGARERLLEELSSLDFSEPELQVFSNTLADRYPSDRNKIAGLLADHLVRPVDFAGEIEAMYRAGARVFVEVGPRNVLTNLIDEILGDRPHVGVASDVMGRNGLLQLQHALGQLFANDVALNLDRLYEGRNLRRHDLATLVEQTRQPDLAPTTWLVNGGRARPLAEAKADKMSTESPRRTPLAVTPETAFAETARTAATQLNRLENKASREASLDVVPTLPPYVSCMVGDGDRHTAEAMLQFNRLMEQFLETQQQVMLSYLQLGNNEAGIASVPAEGRRTVQEMNVKPERSFVVPTVSVAEHGGVTTDEASHSPAPEVTATAIESIGDACHTPERLSETAVAAELLKIVSQRTGYPMEMLGVDRDIEADLGIDSIKRIEILTAFRQACWPSEPLSSNGSMESLTSIKTLRGIIERTLEDLQQLQGAPTAEVQNSEPELPRFVLEAVSKPAERLQSERLPPSVVIVVDDGRRVSMAVMSRLRSRQIRSVLLSSGKNGKRAASCYTAHLGEPLSVQKAVDQIRLEHGPIAGIIHLASLKRYHDDEISSLSVWREHLASEAKSLFYLVRAAGSDLRRPARNGCSWLVAGVSMDSAFGATRTRFLPADGAIRGFVKSMAVEWPDVRCKVIALEPERSPATVAAELVDEILAGDDEIEVGFRCRTRFVLRASESPVPVVPRRSELVIDSDSVILVTGGARGITAEAVCRLAKYRPTLLLLGRAVFPENDESAETAGCSSQAELKSWLIASTPQAEFSTPARVEALCKQIFQEREMRDNVAAMTRAGATVRYFRADARDEDAINNVVKQIYQDYGRLDGVIHGAGIIEDKLLEDKTYESFDRVFDTKLDSAFVLSRAVRRESLKFFAFFSSISGTFGNRGQADYAAANAGLDQLAEYLDKSWPARVISIAWGPWERVGMVAANVRRQFEERGVQIISVGAGARAFERELCAGRKGQVRVVLGGGPWQTSDVTPKLSPAVYVAAEDDVQSAMSAD